MSDSPIAWPPAFTLDQEAVLNLLTGDRFYSNPSAALREAILNAVDAVNRRHRTDSALTPRILVTFDRQARRLVVEDNGVGMSQADVAALFTKVGASAATAEANKKSVGEFGIGVISYFMAGNVFELQTFDGTTEAIGLRFTRSMLAGGTATALATSRTERGTTVILHVGDDATFDLLLESYRHWCRDVAGLEAILLPDHRPLFQGGGLQHTDAVPVDTPSWIERSNLRPVSDPTGWEAMTGTSTISILYRGVFVQEFSVRGLWGIEGSIDVDPKFFKPRLNREGFVAGEFQTEVEQFLRRVHPDILASMADKLASAVAAGKMDRWTEKRWATLWLAVPRDPQYSTAVLKWDGVFRTIPAFEIAQGNRWESASVERLLASRSPIYVAPLADENPNEVVRAATRLMRSSGHTVVRGIRRDRSWMPYAGASYATTADLIVNVFSTELPSLLSIASHAESLLAAVAPVAPLFSGPPPVDLVRLGRDTAPILRLPQRLVINLDHEGGRAIVEEVLQSNLGPISLIGITAHHAYEQLSQVAAVVRDISGAEILSPMRRRFIRSCLS